MGNSTGQPGALDGDGGFSALESVSPGDAVLVTVPPDTETADGICGALVTDGSGGPVDALVIPLTGRLDDRVEAFRAGGLANRDYRLGAITADDTRSTESATEPIRSPDGSTTIWPLGDPSDLTGVMIHLDAALTKWHAPDRRLAVCLHGLEAVLEEAAVETAFRFLHGVLTRLRNAEAVTHVHLDPAGLADTDVNALRMLFDGVVEPDGDGWYARTRTGLP